MWKHLLTFAKNFMQQVRNFGQHEAEIKKLKEADKDKEERPPAVDRSDPAAGVRIGTRPQLVRP